MCRKLTTLMLLLLTALPSVVFSQDEEDNEFIFRPTLGAEVGMLNYYGDLSAKVSANNPIINRIGYRISADQDINEFLNLRFSMLLGNIGANERSLTRNLNFESRITSGSVALAYNFHHLLPEDRVIDPYLSVGFESLEFLSKTDLIDEFGNPYFYWSDGSIRNLAETEENQEIAIRIQRDYEYESDIRELNLDGFGDYAERTWAIPVGIGVNFHLNQKLNFRVGTEMHFTFTDFIDGVTEESVGTRKGNKANDRILYSSIGLSYNLTGKNPNAGPDFSGPDNTDSDLDSIADFMDNCPNTPEGVQVDDKGCPLDSDGDGIADYLDAEPNSPEGSSVDSSGVALTEEDINLIYLEYTDETGKYGKYVNSTYAKEEGERTKRRTIPKEKFGVEIGGGDSTILDSAQANKLLSTEGVTSKVNEEGDAVIEASGFDSAEEAAAAKKKLEEEGIPTGGITKTGTDGQTTTLTEAEVLEAAKLPPNLPKGKVYTTDRPIDSRSVAKVEEDVVKYGDKTIYRVQIGAFSRKLSKDVFEDVDDLFVITTNDGLTRYYSGSFTNYEEAASRKIDLLTQGFEGAHVVPFKQGQKLALRDAGAIPADNYTPPTNTPTAVNKGLVRFKVQIGAYRDQIPTDVMERYMSLGKIEQRSASDGMIKYVVGDFADYESASAFKDELISKGFEGAFTVGDYNGNIIPAAEALELIK